MKPRHHSQLYILPGPADPHVGKFLRKTAGDSVEALSWEDLSRLVHERFGCLLSGYLLDEEGANRWRGFSDLFFELTLSQSPIKDLLAQMLGASKLKGRVLLEDFMLQSSKQYPDWSVSLQVEPPVQKGCLLRIVFMLSAARTALDKPHVSRRLYAVG